MEVPPRRQGAESQHRRQCQQCAGDLHPARRAVPPHLDEGPYIGCSQQEGHDSQQQDGWVLVHNFAGLTEAVRGWDTRGELIGVLPAGRCDDAHCQ